LLLLNIIYKYITPKLSILYYIRLYYYFLMRVVRRCLLYYTYSVNSDVWWYVRWTKTLFIITTSMTLSYFLPSLFGRGHGQFDFSSKSNMSIKIRGLKIILNPKSHFWEVISNQYQFLLVKKSLKTWQHLSRISTYLFNTAVVLRRKSHNKIFLEMSIRCVHYKDR